MKLLTLINVPLSTEALQGMFTLVVQFSCFFWSRPIKKIINLVLVHTVIFKVKPKYTKKETFISHLLPSNLPNIQNNALCYRLNYLIVCAYI